MGVRAHAPAPPPRARPSGPGLGATLVVVLVALVLLLANGRPVGTPERLGRRRLAAPRRRRPSPALAFELDAGGEALVGKALAALFAALAAGALFAAVVAPPRPRRGALGGASARPRHDARRGGAGVVGRGRRDLRRGRGRAAPRPLRGGGRAGPAARAGLPLGLAVALQPSTAALALVLVARRPPALAAGGPPRPRVGRARRARRARVPRPRRPPPSAPAARARGLALLVSPAKGALVFAPVALVGARRPRCAPCARPRGASGTSRSPAASCPWPAASPRSPTSPGSPSPAAGRPATSGGRAGWLRPGRSLLALPARGLRPPEDRRQPAGPRLGRPCRRSAPSPTTAAGTGSTADPAGELGRGRLGRRSTARSRSRPASASRAWPVPGLEGRRLVVRERVLAPSGAAGSFVSFARAPAGPDRRRRDDVRALRLEGGARVEARPARAPGGGRRSRLPRPRGRPGRAGSSCASPAGARAASASARAAWRRDPMARPRRLGVLPPAPALPLPGVGRPRPARRPALGRAGLDRVGRPRAPDRARERAAPALESRPESRPPSPSRGGAPASPHLSLVRRTS